MNFGGLGTRFGTLGAALSTGGGFTQTEFIGMARASMSTGTLATGSWTRLEGRRYLRTGVGLAQRVKFRIWNGYLNASGTFGEVAGPGNLTLTPWALERGTGTSEYREVLRNGLSLDGTVVAPGDYIDTDWLSFSSFTSLMQAPANTVWWLRHGYTKAPTDAWLIGYNGNVTGEGQFLSTASVSQTLGTGAMSAPSGGSAGSVPDMIEVIVDYGAATRDVAFLIIGDSRAVGLTTAGESVDNGTNGGAEWARACRSTALGRAGNAWIPYAKHARGSDQSYGWVQNADSAKMRKLALQNATHVGINFGINDIVTGNKDAATTVGYISQICTDAFAAGVKKVFIEAILTVTGGTIGADPETQTTDAKNSSGGIVDQTNALLQTLAGNSGGRIAFCDTRPIVQVQKLNGSWVWQNGMSTDRIHANATGCAAMATFLATNYLAGLTL